MRALDAHHLAEETAVVGIDDHHAIGPSDVHPVFVMRRDDVVPAAVPAKVIRMSDVVRDGGLPEEGNGGHHDDREGESTHIRPPGARYTPEEMNRG